MGGGLGCDTTCTDDWFLYKAAYTFGVFLRFAKSRHGEAGLKDLALVSGQSHHS